MKYLLIILVILASCKGKPPQSTVETTTINKINRNDIDKLEIYATLPNISFIPIVGTDSLEVVQTTTVVEKVEPEPPEPVPLISLGKKSRGNVINIGSGSAIKEPTKQKIKTIEREPSSGFSVSLPLALGAIALLIVGLFVWWRFLRK